MKAFEHDEMIFNRGVRQGHSLGLTEGRSLGLAEGQSLERQNTERERQRADAAEKELQKLRAKLESLEKTL